MNGRGKVRRGRGFHGSGREGGIKGGKEWEDKGRVGKGQEGGKEERKVNYLP